MPNHLIHETSPYLLQHAQNPVAWYPWGEAALEKARAENKPIFVSIGYAACHWCHVMEKESFESETIAAILNRHFVSIKVDREERPDLDNIYMSAVVAMTGQGGWPMSVFLTPDLKPFYGGTYFPPLPRYGMPSFQELLLSIIQAWENQQPEIERVTAQLTEQLQSTTAWNSNNPHSSSPDTLKAASQKLVQTYDWSFGGWGGAPRFPAPMAIDFLLTQLSRGPNPEIEKLVRHILNTMSRGGLYDLVGGGFHRYSTDDRWLVPHFEKMLYDNAQLALAYLHAYLLTGDEGFRAICEETLAFIQREMAAPEGGFFSSLDADSEGVEGKFYVWSRAEIDAALQDPADLELMRQVYAFPEAGNFEGKIILQKQATDAEIARQVELSNTALQSRLQSIHRQLLEARAARIRPATDDKVLVSWNALALRAFAEAARYLNKLEYLQIARKNAAFLLDNLLQEKQLFRSWRAGSARHTAYLEDYSALSVALLALYQTDPDPRWFQTARSLMETVLTRFAAADGGFYDTQEGQSGLLVRPRETQDNVTPSGNALAAYALLLLAAYDEQGEWHALAEKMVGSFSDLSMRYPRGFAYWLQAMDFAIGPVRQVALLSAEGKAGATASFEHVLWSTFRPRSVVASASFPPPPGAPTLLKNRPLKEQQTTAYVCEAFTCKNPVNTLAGFKSQIDPRAMP